VAPRGRRCARGEVSEAVFTNEVDSAYRGNPVEYR